MYSLQISNNRESSSTWHIRALDVASSFFSFAVFADYSLDMKSYPIDMKSYPLDVKGYSVDSFGAASGGAALGYSSSNGDAASFYAGRAPSFPVSLHQVILDNLSLYTSAISR